MQAHGPHIRGPWNSKTYGEEQNSTFWSALALCNNPVVRVCPESLLFPCEKPDAAETQRMYTAGKTAFDKPPFHRGHLCCPGLPALLKSLV